MLLKMQPRLPQYSLTPSLQALQRTSYGYSDYGSYTAAHYSPSTTSSSTSSAYHQCSGGAHCSMTSAESFSYYEDDGGIHTPSNSNTEEPNSPHDSISSPPLVVSSSNPQSPAICSGGSFSPSGVPSTGTGSTPPPPTMSYGTTAGTPHHHHHHQQETLDASTVAASSPLYKYPAGTLTATTPNYLPMTPYSPSAASYPSLYTTDHSSPSSSSSNPPLQYCSGSTGGAYNGYYFNSAGATSYTPTTALQYSSNSSVYPSEYMHHNTTGSQYQASQNSLSSSSNSFALWNNYPTVQVGKVSYDTPRFKLTPERAIPLIKWFEEHKDHPYPSRHEKMVLCQSTQLTFTQVSTWFANARRRMKKAAHDDEDEDGSISDEDKMK